MDPAQGKARQSDQADFIVRYAVRVFYIAITVTETFSGHKRHQRHHARDC
jgi:hypothetical protein